MLEIIPGSNQAPNLCQKTSVGVDLAPVRIGPSCRLWRISAALYGAMLLLASAALEPVISSAISWFMAWLIFVLAIAALLFKVWREKNAPPSLFWVSQHVWRLQSASEALVVKPCGAILLWAGVIIVPLREALTGRKTYLVVLEDSMNAEDWRRLRVWLRMGLRHNV